LSFKKTSLSRAGGSLGFYLQLSQAARLASTTRYKSISIDYLMAWKKTALKHSQTFSCAKFEFMHTP
jgi:hypothetical protein